MEGGYYMRLRLLAVMLVLCFVGSLQAVPADFVTYRDDFSTDKAMTDSYSHSDFLDELPDPWPLDGFLRYEPPTGDRALTLYCGSEGDRYGWLVYAFPIGGGEAVFDAGAVEFDLVVLRDGGWVRCLLSFDDQGEWTQTPEMSGVGHHRYDFAGPFPFHVVHLEIRGCDASIDDFELTLHHWTPVEGRTWSLIKLLYGGLPN